MARDAFPKHLQDSIRSQLEHDYRNGDWSSDPWFLRHENDWLIEAGFTADLLRRLTSPLDRLYPAELCRRLLLQPDDFGIVFGLFEQMPGFLIPALRVAENLESVPEALTTSLAGQLRSGNSFAAAAAELRIWSALKAAGFTVDRAPGVLIDGTVRRPDFAVTTGGESYLVEVSQLQQSAWSRAARIVEERLFLEADAMLDNRLVRLKSNDAFVAHVGPQLAAFLETDTRVNRAALYDFMLTHLVPPLRAAAQTVRERAAEPGTYEVTGIGTLEVLLGDGTGGEIELMPAPSDAETARRILGKALEEARQLQSGRRRLRRGVVVLDVGEASSIFAVVKELVFLLASGAQFRYQDRLERIDALLLRGSWRRPDGRRATAVYPLINTRVRDPLPSGAMDVFFALGGGWIISPHGADVRVQSSRGEAYEWKGMTARG